MIYYDFECEELVIDTSNSSLRDDLFSPLKILTSVANKDNIDKAKRELIAEIKANHWEKDCDLVKECECYIQRMPYKLTGNKLKLDIFIDASIIEVFADGKKCMTQRAYPSMETSELVKLFSVGGDAKVTALDAWKMDTANV